MIYARASLIHGTPVWIMYNVQCLSATCSRKACYIDMPHTITVSAPYCRPHTRIFPNRTRLQPTPHVVRQERRHWADTPVPWYKPSPSLSRTIRYLGGVGCGCKMPLLCISCSNPPALARTGDLKATKFWYECNRACIMVDRLYCVADLVIDAVDCAKYI